MKKYRWAALAAWTAAMAVSMAAPAYAGAWEKQDGETVLWKYQEEDGAYIRNSWKEIDGSWYYFDGDGVMVTGSYVIDGKEEQFRSDGSWIEGTASVLVAGMARSSGAAVTSAGTTSAGVISSGVIVAGSASDSSGPGGFRWEQDDHGWLYRNADGSCLQNEWRKIKNSWYYFGSDGYMVSNAWVDTDGKRYRVGEDGAMLASQTIQVDGMDYELGADGAWIAPPKTEEELQAEAIAQSIVSAITNDSMGKPQKAAAIYSYVRGNMTYTYAGLRPESGDAAGALYGFRRHTGNCFEYYAMSKYLLEAAGMPNMMVTRASDGDHFWNLVNVDGTWLHFDTTPRRNGGTWCLVTTGQLRGTWSAHNFDVNAYPATP